MRSAIAPPPSPSSFKPAFPIASATAAVAGSEAAPFGIYIHWPFCKSKCPYCDFNSHVRESIDQARWRQALLAELDHYAAETKGRPLQSVFFGGGTPSLMAPETVAALLERIAALFPGSPDLEITLEANPTSVEAERLRAFREAGINRVSLGIQALDPAPLKFLGRTHSAEEALAALETARVIFPRFSFDLIYARPGQDLAGWRDELRRALGLAGDHLSLYQLTIEEGTQFATAYARGDFALPEEEDAAALYELTQEIMEAAGRPAYEISNHARPGGESRHNLVYWRYGDYLGVGPGAHGRLSLAGDKGGGEKWATRQLRAPETWLAAVERSGHGTQERLPVAPEERLEEMVMMGLRLAEGIPRGRFLREAGAAPEALFDERRLAALIEADFIALDKDGLRATPAGRQRLQAVLRHLLA